MILRKPENHLNCYFCVVVIQEINRRKRTYPELESVKRAIPHSNDVPVPAFDHLPELTESSDEISSYVDAAMS